MVMGGMALALGDGADDARKLAAEVDGEMRAELDALKQRCMSWPERTMDCFDDPVFAALHRDECEQASAAAMGATVPVRDAKPGPEPAWTYRFPAKPDPLLVRDNGWVLARSIEFGEDYDSTYRLTAVREGEKAWEIEKTTTAQVLDLGSRGIAVVSEGRVDILDAETGEVTQSLRPSGEGTPGFDPEFGTQPYVAVIAQEGERLWLGDTDAQFFRVDGDAIVYDGALPRESLDSDARLWVEGERRWLWEGGDLRIFDREWKVQASMRAHDSMGSVRVDATGATVVVDGEVLRLDGQACRGTDWFAISKWPHRGDLVMGDECENCPPAPAGCVSWWAHVADVSNAPVAVLQDGAVVASDGEKTLAMRDGETVWSVGTGAAGSAAVADDVFVVSVEETRWRLWSLDAKSGEANWALARPGNDAALYDTDDIHVQAAGPWIVAGFERDVLGLKPGR